MIKKDFEHEYKWQGLLNKLEDVVGKTKKIDLDLTIVREVNKLSTMIHSFSEKGAKK